MAEPTKSPVSLQDVLNYQPDQYLSDDEMMLIRNTFANNKTLLNVLRKVFLPTTVDASVPVEELIGRDLFGMGYNFSQIPEEHIKAIVLARQDAIKFIMNGFITLKALASVEDPSRADLRRVKNSAK